MMRLLSVVVLISALQQFDDAEIQKAIKAGQDKKFSQLISDCVATPGFGEGISTALAGGIQPTGAFDVVLSTNPGRIAFLAAEAKRLYKTFGPENISADLRTPALFVFADPKKPSSSNNVMSVASPIDNMVLKSKSKPEVAIQPQKFETEPVEWANLLGGKVAGNRGVAIFSLEEARNLPAGEVDVVIITQAGERRCKVGNDDRKRLFPPNH